MTASDFAGFFHELNGVPPFPWQSRLAERVLAEGQFPAVLDLPTGSGKTAVLEIALFHLACAPEKAPVRIVFVVDRRLIVDQAHVRAKCIQKKLAAAAPESLLGQVAARLREVAGPGGSALEVALLRGGIPRENDWARSPRQPVMLVSTVDQVGSRLLFRGYGVSDSMKPVHAGLLGSDCVLFLDEAHLSQPFRQTLAAVDGYRSPASAPWRVVTMSATPAETPQFELEAVDRENETLRRRLEVSKPARLEEIGGSGVAERYAKEALEFAKTAGTKVLVVVNRVKLARDIFEIVRRQAAEDSAMLLTGRSREVDRDAVVAKIEARLGGAEPLIAVATQCVEAGADYDFDALVTQVAPIDALKQRFGRLQRTGRADVTARAVILASKEDLRGKEDDPVYGDRARLTWAWLQQRAVEGVVDFGIAHLGPTPAELMKARTDAPMLPPAYLELWRMTSPVPEPDPDVAVFLHGPESGPADAQVVWRADLTAEAEWAEDVLAAAPPRTWETLAVPLRAVKGWLRRDREEAQAGGDAEGERMAEEPSGRGGRTVFRWCGEGDPRTRWIRPDQIRPGDVVVAPASYGGCDEWGWSPESELPVEDVAEARDARFFRIYEGRFSPERWREIRSLLEEVSTVERLSELIPELSAFKRARFVWPYGERLSGAVVQRLSTRGAAATEQRAIAGAPEKLEGHVDRVVARAREFGERLAEQEARAVATAARWHDQGKLDRRFQSYLEASGTEPLAKSGRWAGKNEERRRWEAARLPDGWRHEALSVRLAMASDEFAGAAEFDPELALWLIGTHHGYGRPFFPHDDPLDERDRVLWDETELSAGVGPQRPEFEIGGEDWAGLFGVLVKRYGLWELARMEAVLRLADHRASEEASDEERA